MFFGICVNWPFNDWYWGNYFSLNLFQRGQSTWSATEWHCCPAQRHFSRLGACQRRDLNIWIILSSVLLYCWQRLKRHEKVLVFCLIDAFAYTSCKGCQSVLMPTLGILIVTTAITIMHVLLLDSCQYFPFFIYSCHIVTEACQKVL